MAARTGHGTNKKGIIVALGLVGVLLVGAVSVISFSSNQSTASSERNKYGGLGSAHVHAAFLVSIDGNEIDFSKSQYQVQSPFIHVENRIGTTLHRHALSAPFIEFMESVNMTITSGCLVVDDKDRYCDLEDKKLRFFVNDEEYPASLITSFIISDDDRFLVIYGSETDERIQEILNKLQEIPIFRS